MNENANKFRFSREITLGDLLLAIGAMAVAFKLYFMVGDHEKRLTATETAVQQHASQLAQHETAIAVLRAESRDGANYGAPIYPNKPGASQLIERNKQNE